MANATISGDIIAYTSLSTDNKTEIDNAIAFLLKELKDRFDVFGRVIKGDYLECYIPNPANALRVTLSIKSFIKSISLELENIKDKRVSKYRTHGIRLAIGIGEISRFDADKGIIDGEAIYFSGRIIDECRATSNRKKIVIKKTLFIKSNNEELNTSIDTILALIEVIISKATAKHNKVLYLKLMGKNEEEIAKELNIYQSTVNGHSKSIGWNAIEKAVVYFEEQINHKYIHQ
jgi:hypothetical protein